MSGFIKLKYDDFRYTKEGGNDIWLNIDAVEVFDEDAKLVYMASGKVFRISEDTAQTLTGSFEGGKW